MKKKRRRKTHRLADLQLAIMRVLWDQGEATVTDVHAALLSERGLAPTTIATMLRKMEVKGVVDHRVDGRQFVYRALIEQDDVRQTMLGDLIDRLFRGDVTAAVSHLLDAGEIDADELAELRAIIDKHERDLADGAAAPSTSSKVEGGNS